MKNKIPRATLVIWGIIVAIVIVMATVCIVLILQGKWGIDGNDSSDYIEIKEENIQQDISVIHLNWVSGDVQVKRVQITKSVLFKRVVKIIHRSNYSQLK
ncbi:MAG: hypothetical protein ACLRRA_04505 [Acutalibacteraceae bacterium]